MRINLTPDRGFNWGLDGQLSLWELLVMLGIRRKLFAGVHAVNDDFIFLRFQTAPYLKEDYQEVGCESVHQYLELPTGYDRFSPAWSPETVELAVC